jgi:hypothetical protein
MTDLVPSEQPIDRAALDRIVKRAAELQAQEREIGEGLTEDQLMQLGREVGISTPHLQRALMEERSRSLVPTQGGFGEWLTGPRFVAAARTVSGTQASVEGALHHWMTQGELLQVKRRFPDGTSWERQEGAFASIKRSLSLGGRRYVLARAREVVSRVAALDEERCYVQLVADLSNSFREYLAGSGVIGGGGVLATGVAFLVGVLPPFAVVPGLLAIPVAVAVARSRRTDVERCQVALEQILDRLEHGDIEARRRRGPGPGPLFRLADEIKKSLGP